MSAYLNWRSYAYTFAVLVEYFGPHHENLNNFGAEEIKRWIDIQPKEARTISLKNLRITEFFGCAWLRTLSKDTALDFTHTTTTNEYKCSFRGVRAYQTRSWDETKKALLKTEEFFYQRILKRFSKDVVPRWKKSSTKKVKKPFPTKSISKNEFEDLKVKLKSCSVSMLHDLQSCIGDILRRDAPSADATAGGNENVLLTPSPHSLGSRINFDTIECSDNTNHDTETVNIAPSPTTYVDETPQGTNCGESDGKSIGQRLKELSQTAGCFTEMGGRQKVRLTLYVFCT
jgi:hypothetical protein